MRQSVNKGFQNLTKTDDALQLLLKSLGTPKVRLETVNLNRALARYLGEDMIAEGYLPRFDRSTMDGYAVRSEDVKNSSQERPTVLEVTGESRLGTSPKTRLVPKKAVAVATGSMIPDGGDAVVMVERTTKLPARKIAVHGKVSLGENISKKGDDIRPGNTVLKKGSLLRPQDIGILKALGLERVRVVRRPRVAILSAGNELVASKNEKDPAKVIDINREILSASIKESGAEAIDLGIAGDNEAKIKRALRKGLATADAVLVTAGSSVGKRDLVPKCIDSLGKPGMVVHGVAMRPAMPTGLAVLNGKPVLSLPGIPVSAILAFRVFARPVLAWMMGLPQTLEPVVKATLIERVSGGTGLRTFVRVVVRRAEQGLVAEPLKGQSSSLLMSMVRANGIVTIPEDSTGIESGEVVEVTMIGQIQS